MEITLNGYYTLILATLVLLLGRFLVRRVKFLEDFNIPKRVAAVWSRRLLSMLSIWFGDIALISIKVYRQLPC